MRKSIAVSERCRANIRNFGTWSQPFWDVNLKNSRHNAYNYILKVHISTVIEWFRLSRTDRYYVGRLLIFVLILFLSRRWIRRKNGERSTSRGGIGIDVHWSFLRWYVGKSYNVNIRAAWFSFFSEMKHALRVIITKQNAKMKKTRRERGMMVININFHFYAVGGSARRR